VTWPKVEVGKDSIVSKDQFLSQFAIFTENQLKDIDWNNVFVAGGEFRIYGNLFQKRQYFSMSHACAQKT
jgi:hypothetical protein